MQENRTPHDMTDPPHSNDVPASPTATMTMPRPVASPYNAPIIQPTEQEFTFDDPISWIAPEYIAHTKSIGWYVSLGAIAAVLTAAVFLFTRGDMVSSLAVLIMAILFGVVAGRQPREQHYVLDDEGVHIGAKRYRYDSIKSFVVYDDPPFSSISFMPMRRFMPMISVYYDPADEQQIVEYLAKRLPLEYRRRDPIDRLMHKIRF